MGIESNKEAYQTMKNSIGSMENRMREIYNKGYKDGINEGINQAIESNKQEREMRAFESHEIIKLLDALIGKVGAVGETHEDKRRLDNLYTLMDVTNWCLNKTRYAMKSGAGKAVQSMADISCAAKIELAGYASWIDAVLTEQMEEE